MSDILDIDDLITGNVSVTGSLLPKKPKPKVKPKVKAKVSVASVAKKVVLPKAKVTVKPVMPAAAIRAKVSVKPVIKPSNTVSSLRAKPVVMTKTLADNLTKLSSSVKGLKFNKTTSKVTAPGTVRRGTVAHVQADVVGGIPEKIKAVKKLAKKVAAKPITRAGEQKVAVAAATMSKLANDIASVKKDIAVEAMPEVKKVIEQKGLPAIRSVLADDNIDASFKQQIIGTLDKVNDTIINERDIAFKRKVLSKLKSIDNKMSVGTLAYQGAFL